MTKTELFAALMASTLLAAPAMAQSTQPSPTPPMADQNTQRPIETNKRPMATAPAATQTVQQAGQWRMSKLVGLDVYNNNNEKIGDINELIADKDGNVQILVIGVGGFLGMGQHDVGLAWDQVKFVAEPVKTASSSTTRTTTTTTTTGSGATATTTTATRDYPDHAVVSMTKDQLKALPAFKYASDTKNR
jgi:sporulation protein YlmC with PRC-barrel domain